LEGSPTRQVTALKKAKARGDQLNYIDLTAGLIGSKAVDDQEPDMDIYPKIVGALEVALLMRPKHQASRGYAIKHNGRRNHRLDGKCC
jgi:hypothetical protein